MTSKVQLSGQRIWVVCGQVSDYEYMDTWVVDAFSSKKAATDHVAALQLNSHQAALAWKRNRSDRHTEEHARALHKANKTLLDPNFCVDRTAAESVAYGVEMIHLIKNNKQLLVMVKRGQDNRDKHLEENLKDIRNIAKQREESLKKQRNKVNQTTH